MVYLDLKTHTQGLIDIFPVKEILEPGKVSAGIATTEKDRLARLAVVTERYLDQDTQYITEADLNPDRLYVDPYESVSIPLVAKVDDEVAASFRIIPNTPEIGLPINNESKIIINQEWKNNVRIAKFELSQLAKSKSYDRDPRPHLAVIKAYMGIADRLGIPTSVAVIDDRVINLLNGPYLGFDLWEIGPSVFYLGSSSTPVFIDINQVRQNSRNNGHPELADFLEGKKVKGFEWYVGP